MITKNKKIIFDKILFMLTLYFCNEPDIDSGIIFVNIGSKLELEKSEIIWFNENPIVVPKAI